MNPFSAKYTPNFPILLETLEISKLKKPYIFGELPIAKKRLYAGFVIVDLNTTRVNILNHMMIEKNPTIITVNFEGWIENKGDKTPNKGETI